LDDEISECKIINIMRHKIKSTQEFRGANMKIIDTNYIRPVSLGKSRQSIARVYHLLLKGVSESDLKKKNFKEYEIEKAKEYRDKYQDRSVLVNVIAKELKISKHTAKKLMSAQRDYLG